MTLYLQIFCTKIIWFDNIPCCSKRKYSLNIMLFKCGINLTYVRKYFSENMTRQIEICLVYSLAAAGIFVMDTLLQFFFVSHSCHCYGWRLLIFFPAAYVYLCRLVSDPLMSPRLNQFIPSCLHLLSGPTSDTQFVFTLISCSTFWNLHWYQGTNFLCLKICFEM